MQRALQLTRTEHKPVLLDAAIAGLSIQPDGLYVDATYGRGGHSAAMLARLAATGRLLAFDRDPDACAHAWRKWQGDTRFHIEHRNFACMRQVCLDGGLLGRVNGVLFDLGMSSPQLDMAERGFSFGRDGPLDMRMDPTAGVSAAQWLGSAEHGEIARVLKVYGDERHAGRIASAIVAERELAPIETTAQLARIVRAAVPARIAATARIHPATRSFQALRIHVNDELGALRTALEQSLELLAPGGRLVVISFHSLEDRIVKRFMRDQAKPDPGPLPMAPAPDPKLELIGKQQRAGADELASNPRARSAVLRVARRTEVPA